MAFPDSLTSWLIVAAPALPLLTAFLLAAPAMRRTAIRWSPLAALPALLVAVAGATVGDIATVPFAPVFSLGLDETGRVFLGFSSVLWLLSAWFARGYLPRDRNETRFHVFFLLSMAGNFALILARDIPAFYSGFALMGFASCGLVAHRGDSKAIRAGRIYLALAVVGEVLLFVAFGWLAAQAGSVEIAAVVGAGMPMLPMILLLIGFGIKAGALSLHFWLPLAHPVAPVPASAVLSGAMIKAGLYGWLRFLPLGMVAMRDLGIVLICVGLAAALLATVAGVTQRNAKTVLAYSSLSQMGIVTVGLGVAFLQPEAWPGLLSAVSIYALHHALSKGSLFLSIAPVAQASNRFEIFLARAGLLLPALAMAGAPFTSGALAKLALKSKLDYLEEPWGHLVGFALTLAATGTTLLMARFLRLTWPSHRTPGAGAQGAVWAPWMVSVAFVLAGIWWLPGAIEKMGDYTSPAKLWMTLWPLLAGGAMALLGNWLLNRLRLRTPKEIPPGDVVVPLERLFDRWRTRFGREKLPDESRAAQPHAWSRWASVPGAIEARLRVFSNGAALLVVLVLLFLILLMLG